MAEEPEKNICNLLFKDEIYRNKCNSLTEQLTNGKLSKEAFYLALESIEKDIDTQEEFGTE